MNVTFKLNSALGKLLRITLFFFLLIPFQLSAQDSLATVNFYRPSKMDGPFVSYDIKLGDVWIGKARPNSVITYRTKPGDQTFKASTSGESSFRLIAEAGKTYFVECGIGTGAAAGKPTFRLASSAQAQKEIEKIVNSVPVGVSQDSPQADTTRALHNLFQRKRTGGTVRAIVFGLLGFTSLINTINYRPTTVTINQGSAGTQTIPIDDSPPPANYVFIGFSAIMVITGAAQVGNYSTNNLDALLKDYGKGMHLPVKFKNKLKQKDFK
jgi:hypothetical protein